MGGRTAGGTRYRYLTAASGTPYHADTWAPPHGEGALLAPLAFLRKKCYGTASGRIGAVGPFPWR